MLQYTEVFEVQLPVVSVAVVELLLLRMHTLTLTQMKDVVGVWERERDEMGGGSLLNNRCIKKP